MNDPRLDIFLVLEYNINSNKEHFNEFIFVKRVRPGNQ